MSRTSTAVLVLLAATCFTPAATGQIFAQLPAHPEREVSTPTDWVKVLAATPADILKKMSQGYRIVTLDRRVLGSTSPVFDVCFVHNSGEYKRSGPAFYYGTASFIASKLSGKRITDLEPYSEGGKVQFAAAMVDNTKGQLKTWSWYYGTLSFIASKIGTSNRIVDLDQYWDKSANSYLYSAVLLANKGVDQRNWWWYPSLTQTQLVTNALTLKAQVLDYEMVDVKNGQSYCVVYTQHATRATPGYVWLSDKTLSEVDSAILKHRCRPIKSAGEYFTLTPVRTDYYSVLMIENRASATVVGRSCRGPVRTPSHAVTGIASPGKTITMRLDSGPASAPAILLVGRYKSVHLAFLGASGCYLYVDPLIALPMATNSTGYAGISAPVPGNLSLGDRWYTQFACRDGKANTFGHTTTNAVRVEVGQ